jgi:S1-C subfamily serine protease
VTDAYIAMGTSAAFGASSDLSKVVDLDDDIAYLRVARSALTTIGSAQAQSLVGKIDRLLDALGAKRAKVGEALASVESTFEAAESALDATATCRSVDLRASPAKAKSPACQPARRLWQAARGVDLTSDVSSSAIAAQVGEIRLDGERADVRARLAAALKDHARALRRFHEVAAPKRDEEDAQEKALKGLESDVVAALETTSRYCLAHVGDAERIVGGEGADVRHVTVTVRPRWSGSLADLPHDEEFGSGFVVRWRASAGQIETRIVTNNHVMDGAFEADITSGDAVTAVTAPDGAKLSATLVEADPHEDVAILRVDAKSEGSLSKGVAFRFVPAHEDEQVVAAGFPGVGITPSFQVSRGTVSNAHFGLREGDDDASDAYIQHTAPIDPGNSGGPLLDERGNLLGMNTLKIVGRDNVGLAIPTVRIQAALVRAEKTPTFDPKHAEASCNAMVAALASPHPTEEAMSRFGLALYESTLAKQGTAGASAFRQAVKGDPENPADVARWRAYGATRVMVAGEGGLRPYEVCRDVRPGRDGTFTATFPTRTQTHQVTLAAEHGVIRAVRLD